MHINHFLAAVFMVLTLVYGMGLRAEVGTSEAPPANELQAIQEAFSSYKSATLDNNGEIAAGLVTGASVDHFEKLRQAALYATWQELREFRTLDKMYVWVLRVSIGADDLLDMSGTQVLSWFYTKGHVGDNINKMASLRDVEFIEPGVARGVIYVGKARSPEQPMFKKEEAGWRYSLVDELNYLNNRMREVAEEVPFVENDLAQAYVQLMTGKRLEPSHMHPLVNREAAVSESEQ